MSDKRRSTSLVNWNVPGSRLQMNFWCENESRERHELKVLHPGEDLEGFVEEDRAQQKGHLRVRVQQSPGPDDDPEGSRLESVSLEFLHLAH